MPRAQIAREDWPAVMAAARRRLGAGNPYGVVAFGIHRRTVRGAVTSVPALNAYVAQKEDDPRHPVPALELRLGKKARGLVVRPDVIGVGASPRAHDAASARPLMTGIHPGAAIFVAGDVRQYGGVACLLGEAGTATHLLTSGHLFAPGRVGAQVQGALRDARRVVIGTLHTNLLDAPFATMEWPVDVALVALTRPGMRMAEQSRGGPVLTEVVSQAASGGIDVTAFLPTAHDYSRATTTLDGPVDAEMQSPARGTYRVHDVGATSAAITNPGDSGSIVFNGPSTSATAVGVCVGQLGAMSIFEPIARALAIVNEGTGMSLQIVRKGS